MLIHKRGLFFVLSLLVLIGAIAIAISVGASQIDGLISALLHPSANNAATEILWQIRIPRIATALIVGAALGVAGGLGVDGCGMGARSLGSRTHRACCLRDERTARWSLGCLDRSCFSWLGAVRLGAVRLGVVAHASRLLGAGDRRVRAARHAVAA